MTLGAFKTTKSIESSAAVKQAKELDIKTEKGK
jgi:hypothetical protein